MWWRILFMTSLFTNRWVKFIMEIIDGMRFLVPHGTFWIQTILIRLSFYSWWVVCLVFLFYFFSSFRCGVHILLMFFFLLIYYFLMQFNIPLLFLKMTFKKRLAHFLQSKIEKSMKQNKKMMHNKNIYLHYNCKTTRSKQKR